MQGVITKGISGFYYVYCEGRIYECKAKGLFRKKGITPLAGDLVEISINDDGTGSVDCILPRKNAFSRPPVANVDCFILVAAYKNPDPSYLMIDRFTAYAEKLRTDVVLCFNKSDLSDENTEDPTEIYKDIYPVFSISSLEKRGIDRLRSYIQGKQIALAGPSGSGKSTLTNLLIGDNSSQTGEISERLMRGKNTTRHSQLFKGDGYFVFDTPGFTDFEPEFESLQEIASCFPDIDRYIGKCRFSDCRHINEPDCAVLNALKEGSIKKTRYESYKDLCETFVKKKKY